MKTIIRKSLLKLLETALSAKMQIIAVSTVALFYDKLESTAYATIVTAIALGRVMIESIVANRGNDEPKAPISE